MKFFHPLLILLFGTLFYTCAYSQQKKDSTFIGVANGIIRDSAYNFMLQSATLAIYKVGDNTLVSYQLSSNVGGFHFEALPVGIALMIKASFAGYKTLTVKFSISPKEKTVNLKALNMERGENLLEDAVVTAAPPVKMNGDTLEFNADAFKLDKNAVAEDLLRRLPGVTVWGDGTITVNGKQVSQVLVDGKPFFGGDPKVTTQNLPKDAVDKIQVYQQSRNNGNATDSLTEVNIKLKKNKRFGHFGKLAAGYGTDEHYEADANINFFSPRTQIGIVGTSNNTNKVANDANTLLRNSTYKGVGANVEYQSDFNMQGINRSSCGGLTFQHDFIPDADYYKNNRLTGDYFIKNTRNETNSNAQTTTSLGGDSVQVQQNTNNAQSTTTGQNLSAKYDKHKDDNDFYNSINLNTNNSTTHNQQQSSASNSWGGLQSTNNTQDDVRNSTNGISFQAGYSQKKGRYSTTRLPSDLDIRYSLYVGSFDNDQTKKTAFVSLASPLQDVNYNRHYSRNSSETKQHLSFSLGDFYKTLFGKTNAGYRNRPTWMAVKLQNNIDLNTHTQHNLVEDAGAATGTFIKNEYLSVNGNYTVVNEQPALNFEKRFSKELASRYSKSLSVNVLGQTQLYHQQNTSDHSFQNIGRDYKKFVPNASISYNNYQYGAFNDNYNLKFTVSADHPTFDQLVPLVDSSNQYYIQQGNIRLLATDKKELTFNLVHSSQRAKNTFNYNINLSAGLVNNSFSDSSITDSIGRSSHYTVNMDGYKYFNTSANLNKAFKFVHHQLQVNLYTALYISKNPSYINSVKNWSNSLSNNSNLNLTYSYKDKIAINLGEGYSFYRSQQSGASNNIFNNSVQSTKLSASVNCTKRLTVGSNITNNHNTSTGSGAIDFTIWNANATYRLLPGNNLELKFSALDLLHQNTSFINYGNNNVLTHGTANVLQQYFMFTLSYYPRKFGKKEKKG